MNLNSPVKIWRKQKESIFLLGKKGKIITYSLIHIPPLGFSNQAPYPIVIVEFPDGKRRTGQLVDWTENDLKIGSLVEGVIRRIREEDKEGVIPYGIKYKLVREEKRKNENK